MINTERPDLGGQTKGRVRMTDACGRPDGKTKRPQRHRYEVRYTNSHRTIRLAGWDADPEAKNTIAEITDDWVELRIIDTEAKPPKVIKTIDKEVADDG